MPRALTPRKTYLASRKKYQGDAQRIPLTKVKAYMEWESQAKNSSERSFINDLLFVMVPNIYVILVVKNTDHEKNIGV